MTFNTVFFILTLLAVAFGSGTEVMAVLVIWLILSILPDDGGDPGTYGSWNR